MGNQVWRDTGNCMRYNGNKKEDKGFSLNNKTMFYICHFEAFNSLLCGMKFVHFWWPYIDLQLVTRTTFGNCVSGWQLSPWQSYCIVVCSNSSDLDLPWHSQQVVWLFLMSSGILSLDISSVTTVLMLNPVYF